MNEKKSFFRATAEDFKKIPGSSVAYWASEVTVKLFSQKLLCEIVAPRAGLATGDNNLFQRYWFEVSVSNIGFGKDSTADTIGSRERWFPCNSGSEFRKWSCVNELVVDWKDDGQLVKSFRNGKGKLAARPQNTQYYFKEGITWNKLSSSRFSVKYKAPGFIFDDTSRSMFPNDLELLWYLIGLLCSNTTLHVFKILNPSMSFTNGDIERMPFVLDKKMEVDQTVKRCIQISSEDESAYETSWNFKVNPLVALARGNLVNPVNPVEREVVSGQWPVIREQGARAVLSTAHCPLSTLYAQLRQQWAESCEEMRRLETENNRIFIEAYGLQDELTPEVSWDEITLTCNPWYRYNAKCGMRNEELGGTLPKDAELEKRLMADTVKELISYAVGCMMGRYSLDKPGLILADQGSTIADYYKKVGSGQLSVGSGERSGQWSVISDQKGDTTLSTDHCPLPTVHFSPDEDGIIPVLDNDWFADDIVTRFKEFIKVAFGEEHFFENMTWIEDALGKDIRSYFTKDFYKDHLQRYQNRPIYWLFQSPKGAFRALVYMHRYKPDMVGGVLGYLRSLQTKVANQLNVAMQIGMDESKNASERVRANKDAVKYAKAKKELDEYERNVLYPLSTERIEIDLDDGVKVNYRKFGSALRKVAALEGKGE